MITGHVDGCRERCLCCGERCAAPIPHNGGHHHVKNVNEPAGNVHWIGSSDLDPREALAVAALLRALRSNDKQPKGAMCCLCGATLRQVTAMATGRLYSVCEGCLREGNKTIDDSRTERPPS